MLFDQSIQVRILQPSVSLFDYFLIAAMCIKDKNGRYESTTSLAELVRLALFGGEPGPTPGPSKNDLYYLDAKRCKEAAARMAATRSCDARTRTRTAHRAGRTHRGALLQPAAHLQPGRTPSTDSRKKRRFSPFFALKLDQKLVFMKNAKK